MYFTNSANLAYVPSLMPMPSIGSVTVDSMRRTMRATTDKVEMATNKVGNSFEQTLLLAFDKLNELQLQPEKLAEQQIINPESVDPHDITIAMGKANLSLSLAATLIDRVVKAWNDISITR